MSGDLTYNQNEIKGGENMQENRNTDELYHHGRMGMKWYQHIFGQAYKHAKYNKNAKTKTKEKMKTLDKDTKEKIRKMKVKAREDAKLRKAKIEADKRVEETKKMLEKKYGINTKHSNKENKKESKKESTKESTKESIKDLSEEELRTRTNRLNAEKNYIEAVRNRAALEETNNKSKSFVQKTLNNIIDPAVSNVGQQILQSLMVAGANKALKLENSEYKFYTNNKKK